MYMCFVLSSEIKASVSPNSELAGFLFLNERALPDPEVITSESSSV
jgi:hypothetical protein